MNCKGLTKNGKPCNRYPWAMEDPFCCLHDPETYLRRANALVEWIREHCVALELDYELKRAELQRKHEKKKNAQLKRLQELMATRAWCERRMKSKGSQP